MIHPKDLRKGNIVNTFLNTTEGKLYKKGMITCLHMNTVECENNKTFPYTLLEPIPISPELLVKCGLTKNVGTIANPEAIYFDFDRYRFYIGEKCSVHLFAGQGWYPGLKDIEGFHTFQNWYYYNIGTELEVDLKKLL